MELGNAFFGGNCIDREKGLSAIKRELNAANRRQNGSTNRGKKKEFVPERRKITAVRRKSLDE